MDERAAHLRERVARIDAVLAPTRFALARALDWGVDANRLRLAPLGAVVEAARPRPAGARRRLGYVGTLAPHKGAHVLLEAARGLQRSQWSLDLFGNDRLDPGYTDRLRALAGADARIRFRGKVAPDEQHRIWSSIDLLVVPSLWWENSPLTVLEALASGIPVIASRTGGVPELISPDAGALVEPGDVASLRQAIEDALDGRSLASALGPLPIKTALDGARELVELYGEVSRKAGS
jgi:glycosyltransferase involved in cell wall biosynthesis